MSLVIIFIKRFEIGSVKTLVFSFILGGIAYIVVLLLLKEEICVEGIKIIKKKVKNI